MLDIDKIRARAEAAASGPWKVMPHPFGDSETQGCVMASEEANNILVAGACVICRVEDCEFVAAAREDVPNLVTEVERLRAVVDALPKCFKGCGWPATKTSGQRPGTVWCDKHDPGSYEASGGELVFWDDLPYAAALRALEAANG